ncbi:hypothetical protein [Streptomyces sp. B93]|uniref:hypothetical protein n=1 Tax=Streptomyces sp. B93 TaxID=2824875 RepID=UPI001B399414|nr:hypothetical protein [Streptomyces sp. B93]MBQ1090237.1 hypothetical protein [Streptomyces sp. B93]
MGYWGYFVVGRGQRPLGECEALAGAAERLTRREQKTADGWQLWEYPNGDGDVGSMNVLARETGAPALFGYVMDSACVIIEAAAPESGAWTACLGRAAMARYIGAGQEGLTLEDYFLEPRDAAGRAVAWAAEGGLTVAAEPLLGLLTADPDPVAENLLFRFLDRLGVVPL